MPIFVEISIAIFLVISGIFGLVGSYGLIRLRDTMQRLHAPTKATTLGVGGVLIASMLYFLLVEGSFSFHELMITLFLFLTAPITAHFIAKAYLHRNERPESLPDSEGPHGWAVYDDPPGGPTDGPMDGSTSGPETQAEILNRDGP